MPSHYFFILLLMSFLILIAPSVKAGEVTIAVATNFRFAMIPLVKKFEENSLHSVVVSFGSTGKHYAQIKQGAPYDIFLAADQQRPQLLENNNLIIDGQRMTYAIGKLVLWSPHDDLIQNNTDQAIEVLNSNKINYLAIANSKLAPYGLAAEQVLSYLNLFQSNALKKKIVRGENISQTFQFVDTGNANLGFVSYSQLMSAQKLNKGSYWQVPQEFYAPIIQQAVLLEENVASKAFFSFLQSDMARAIISQYGYELPDLTQK